MRPWLLALPALALFACEKDDTGDNAGALTGSLVFEDGETAAVNAEVAFGYNRGTSALIYFSSNPAATCEDVAIFLGNERGFDPTNLFLPGHCNVQAVINDYDDAGVSITSDPVKVTWALNCTIGEGSWEWEERGDDDGYYWSGRWWMGGPSQWSLTASGGGGGAFDIEADMNEYHGSYTEEFITAGADGLVSGGMRPTWCGDLETNPFF